VSLIKVKKRSKKLSCQSYKLQEIRGQIMAHEKKLKQNNNKSKKKYKGEGKRKKKNERVDKQE